MTTDTMNSLQQEAVLFALKIGQFRIRKNADRSRVDTTAERRLLAVRKRILDSDEYRKIESLDNCAREYVLARSLPSPLGRGVYLLPLTLVPEVMRWLDQYRAQREILIDKFLAVYPEQRDAMAKALGDLYDPADYPTVSAVRERYWISTMMMELNAPTVLASISEAMYHEEEQRVRNMWGETRELITQALYAEASELVSGLAERLTTKPGEKEHVLRDSVVEKFQAWLAVFDSRNLTRDARLQTIVERARQVVNGVSGQAIRDSAEFRKELAGEFATINRQLVAAVAERPRRKIRIGEMD